MNLLFIFTDQQNRYALSCMGNPNLETPNLDKLASRGVLFNRCYTNDPICGPFRGTLMTGQYASRCGVVRNELPLPEGVTTFADAYNNAGYSTSWVGKWHLGGKGQGPIEEKLRGGFQHFIGYQCYNGFKDNVVFHDQDDKAHHFEKHRTEVTTDLAIEQLEIMTQEDMPFMLMMSYQAPHYPEQPSEYFEKLYANKPIVRRANCRDVNPHTPTGSPRSPRPVSSDPDYQRYGNDLDEYIRLYNAMCAQIDANVGRLMDKLEELGVADNTMIVFTSDHGDMQGSHGLKNKCLPHEESSGIPLIVYLPGQEGGIKSDALVSGVDMMPSCLDVMGLPPVESVDGKSFAPILRGETQEEGTAVFVERGDWCMIVQDNWKLVAKRKENNFMVTMMFNLDEDPYEQENLVKEASISELRTALCSKLKHWNDNVKRHN